MFAKSMTLSPGDIERAFAQDEFDIVLQPQIDVADGGVVAAEAFVRWSHPAFGTMTPQMFLPHIDAMGESARLLEAVMNRSVAAAAAIAEAGRVWKVSVNLGPSDLLTGVAPEIVAAALSRARVAPDRLILEAPEAAFASHDPMVHEALARLRDMGCGVALDSGAALPLDASETAPDLFTEIKIGGAAILRFAEIARKVDGGRIQRRLAFAEAHGLRAVAVGVEQPKTLAALVRLGFGAIQGTLVARPTSLDALLAWDGTWAGAPEFEPVEIRPVRPRPQLVTPATPEALQPTSALAPKLVEHIGEDMSDDAFDVGFDDDVFDDEPEPAMEAIVDDYEVDPTEDVMPDGEELAALDNASPLHAGMIERPRKRMVSYLPEMEPTPAPVPAETGSAAIDRPLALRIKAPPSRRTWLQWFGFRRSA